MSNKKSDELAIDFSKILNFFKSPAKGKQKKSSHSAAATHKETEEVVQDKDQELSLDIKGIWNIMYKYRIFLLILIPLFLSIFLRVQPLYLPQTDIWAENSVQNYYQSQISAQVRQQYPNLPAENLNAIVNDETQKYINTHKNEYEQQIEGVSQNFKAHFQDETGQTYLLAIDPYQWYRYGKDIADHGYAGDKKIDGVPYDMHMLAPNGRPATQEFHPYLGAYLYSIFGSLFGMNLMGIFFILPIILMSLAVIPAFFVGKRIGGTAAGFFSAVIIAMHPAILTRTVGGFSDTDSYPVLFPLIITWLIIEAFEQEDLKYKIAYSGLAAVFTGLFAFAWYGWWYIFDFAVGAIGIYLVYYIVMEYFVKKKKLLNSIKDDKKVRDSITLLAVFFVLSGIFVSIAVSWNNFFSAVYSQPLSVIYLKEAAKATLWPNVYTTVAEMNAASIDTIISTMGGKIYFIISIIGVLLILFNSWKEDKRIMYFAIIALWFAGAFYASTKGIRFTLIMAPAFAIGFGVALSFVYKYAGDWVSNEMNISKSLVRVIMVILLCMLLIPTYNAAKATALGEIPSMNDAWNSALTKIKLESKEDAIINSWWDFGHWFKAMGDRAVTFDGASQNQPQAHWIGRALQTSDEKQAVGILRMLDCGANRAFEILNKETNKTHLPVDVLYEMIVLDKDGAREVLNKRLPDLNDAVVEEVLKNTHCDPPEDYFITSGDMVGKAGVWAHFGLWNFDKARIWRDARKLPLDKAVDMMKKEFGYSEEEAKNIYSEIQNIQNEQEANNWISPWPGYVSSSGCAKKSNSTIICQFSLQGQNFPIFIDIDKEEAYLESGTGTMHPYSFSYINSKQEFKEKKYENNTIPYSMALIVKSDSITGILMSPQLASSMFTRLYYFDGIGLEHFDFFDYQRDMTGLEIYTWKVDWDGKEGAIQ